MKVINSSYEILFFNTVATAAQVLEYIGRICYRSEDKITDESAEVFIRRIIDSGHESVLEHLGVTVFFEIDRGVSHEIVRHRLCAFTQESTRYCNYSKGKFGKEITVIKPCFWQEGTELFDEWFAAMVDAERHYMRLLELGASPQQARAVLPNSLKTGIYTSCNFREWRHVMKMRCSEKAHPQMREVMIPLLKDFKTLWPVLFYDIYPEIQPDVVIDCSDMKTSKKLPPESKREEKKNHAFSKITGSSGIGFDWEPAMTPMFKGDDGDEW